MQQGGRHEFQNIICLFLLKKKSILQFFLQLSLFLINSNNNNQTKKNVLFLEDFVFF